MWERVAALIVVFLFLNRGFGQEPFLHFSTSNGLPTSVVYDCLQDQQGFVWFATDAGVYRFDGGQFKGITVKEGLPDNEIVQLVEDSFSRIWGVTLKQKLLFIKNDTVNINDPVKIPPLSKTHILPFFIGKSNKNNLYILSENICKINQNSWNICVKLSTNLTNSNVIAVLESTDNRKLFFISSKIVVQNYTGKYTLKKIDFLDDGILDVEFLNDSIAFVCTETSIYKIKISTNGDLILMQKTGIEGGIISMSRLENRLILATSSEGIKEVDLDLKTHLFLWHENIQGSITHVLIDRQRNIWVTTLDKGIYFISNKQKTIFGKEEGVLKERSYSFVLPSDKGALLLGAETGELFDTKNNQVHELAKKSISKTKIRSILQLNSTEFFAINRFEIIHYKEGKMSFEDLGVLGALKCLVKENDSLLLLGASANMGFYNYKTHKIISKIENVRVTTCLKSKENGSLYFGNYNGLSKVNLNSKVINLKSITSPVNQLEPSRYGGFWVLTLNNGIYYFSHDSVKGHYNPGEELLGNICRYLFVDSMENLWVASNKGVHKICTALKNKEVIFTGYRKFGFNEGLYCNNANTVFVKNKQIYTATNEGVFVLYDSIYQIQKVNPILASLKTNLRTLRGQEKYIFDHTENYLTLTFSVPYFGLDRNNLIYSYRLLGTDSTWHLTANNQVEFLNLPPNNYAFQFKVYNSDQLISLRTETIQIQIKPALYQKTWFQTLLVFCLMIGAYLISQWVSYSKRENAIRLLRLNELEQKVVIAQLNPHFVFNSLNSIQHFINKNEKHSANMYLAKFAKLMRQTLRFSREREIILADEISFLEAYIQLEQMRFSFKFQYEIIVQSTIKTDVVKIPPMMLQPFVENAIIHGLSFSENLYPTLTIHFIKSGNDLICEIDDNGVGINKSGKKLAQHKSYATELTQNRIDLLNTSKMGKIKLDIIDKGELQAQQETGTMVVLRFIGKF